MTELFDEIDDILNGAPEEAAELETPASGENNYNETDKKDLYTFLHTNLDRKRLLKAKEVVYDKDNGKILSLAFN